MHYLANALYCTTVDTDRAEQTGPESGHPPAGAKSEDAGRSPAPAALLRAVGERVRALRHERHLTLDELSARSGVSRRMITMLEAGETNASLGTLDKLARGLGCDFATLVAARPVEVLVPAATRSVPPMWEDARGSSARLLVARTTAGVTELWQWHLVAGARYDAEADPPGSEEILLVTVGRLVVEVADERYEMRAGGYLRLPTDVPYAYVNPGRATTRFIRVILMP